MKKQLILITTLVVVVGSLIAWAILWMRAPATGNVTTISTPNKASTNASDKKLNGTYISLNYKGIYTTHTETANNGSVERYTLEADTQYNKQILISVSNLSNGQLESNGDYLYRQKSPEVYTKRQLIVGAGTADIWVKKDGTEQTAMVPRGDKLAIVSFVTGSGSTMDVTTEMDTLLKSLEWKK